jgi:hypothetical protein
LAAIAHIVEIPFLADPPRARTAVFEPVLDEFIA